MFRFNRTSAESFGNWEKNLSPEVRAKWKMGNLTLFTRTSALGSYWKLSTAAHFVCINKTTSTLKREKGASKDTLIQWNVS